MPVILANLRSLVQEAIPFQGQDELKGLFLMLVVLPWPVEDFKNLDRQFEWVKGIPEVPGGYYTSRNLTNAFATVVIDKKVGPREALTDSVRYINDEIENKRKEFGLD